VKRARSADELALLRLHEQDRRAHLEGDAELLTSAMADQVWESSRGALTLLSRAELRDRFAAYFAQVRYTAWDDLGPAHVVVSEDGQSGWMAVAIDARLAAPDADDHVRERAFESSWIATYAKMDGRWLMTGIATSVVDRS